MLLYFVLCLVLVCGGGKRLVAPHPRTLFGLGGALHTREASKQQGKLRQGPPPQATRWNHFVKGADFYLCSISRSPKFELAYMAASEAQGQAGAALRSLHEERCSGRFLTFDNDGVRTKTSEDQESCEASCRLFYNPPTQYPAVCQSNHAQI